MFGGFDYTIFGVSWLAVGAILVALVRKYAPAITEEAVKLGAAGWVVLGFFINSLYVNGAWVFPAAPEGWASLVLQAVIVFGAVLGLAPGTTVGRAFRAFRR